jgi:hypothetical protein
LFAWSSVNYFWRPLEFLAFVKTNNLRMSDVVVKIELLIWVTLAYLKISNRSFGDSTSVQARAGMYPRRFVDRSSYLCGLTRQECSVLEYAPFGLPFNYYRNHCWLKWWITETTFSFSWGANFFTLLDSAFQFGYTDQLNQGAKRC